MVSLQNIIDQVKSYDAKAEVSLIQKAYDMASKAHSGQKRASGEPYLTHPIEVAEILAHMKLDSASIAAGLLHDTVEDTLITLETIKKEFGEDIALLVDGVTKLSKIKISSAQEKQAKNFRKMILAMAADIRVVLIKLADRLHNMRTLTYLDPDRQRKIAEETNEIYAPLANRLGIQWMKIELEDYCLKYLKPEIYKAINEDAEARRKGRSVYMEKVKAVVEAKLIEYKIPYQISGRLKHNYSIYRKMQSQNISFDQVHDIIAYRIIVDNIRQCYEVLGMLHELWKPVPGRFKDYIAMPKINHYQSLHTTVICLEGQRVEFQIRTKKMHEVAEAGIAAHWTYKEDGAISKTDREKFQWLRELIELQKDLKDPAEFLDTVKLDLFATDVYVFTPQGELKEIPYGSTPIDFAYSVHTDVGNQCVGAKVNDKIVPLDYRLKSGDTVTILTRPQSRPSRDWLSFVKSSRAKAKIRHEIKLDQRDKAIEIGRDMIQSEISKCGVKPTKILQSRQFLQLAQEHYHLKDTESLMAQVGYGKVTAVNIVSKLFPEKVLKVEKTEEKKPGILGELIKKARRKSRTGIKVGGHHDILVSLGKCCAPLPGDPITGFITRGRGVMIHSVNCSKVLANDPERRIDVEWDLAQELSHQVKLKTITIDRPGILASMSKLFSNKGVNITQANIRTSGDEKAVNIFNIEVKDRKQLDQVIRALEGLKGVISVNKMTS